jgi:hypothetical protein
VIAVTKRTVWSPAHRAIILSVMAVTAARRSARYLPSQKKEVIHMKSKISVIVGSVLALAITATAPVYAKGCDCTGQQDYSIVDKPVQLPPQTPQPINSAPKSNASGADRVAGGGR